MMVIVSIILMFTLFSVGATSGFCDDVLPVCNNRTISEVTKRVGCTVGDSKCWLLSGGFCTDYVQKKAGKSGKPGDWIAIMPMNVRKGDIAVFYTRVHYAYVESVIKDKQGKPVSVNLSEYNFGTCWVDEQLMVTDKYKLVNKRSNIPLHFVDGGFLRISP